MILATILYILGFAATMLAVLCFCLVWRPGVWLRIWNPWWQFVGASGSSWKKSRLLLGVRVRSAMMGVVTLVVAMSLPLLARCFFAAPSARAEESLSLTAPAGGSDAIFIFKKIPRHSSVPVSEPPSLASRLRLAMSRQTASAVGFVPETASRTQAVLSLYTPPICPFDPR